MARRKERKGGLVRSSGQNRRDVPTRRQACDGGNGRPTNGRSTFVGHTPTACSNGKAYNRWHDTRYIDRSPPGLVRGDRPARVRARCPGSTEEKKGKTPRAGIERRPACRPADDYALRPRLSVPLATSDPPSRRVFVACARLSPQFNRRAAAGASSTTTCAGKLAARNAAWRQWMAEPDRPRCNACAAAASART